MFVCVHICVYVFMCKVCTSKPLYIRTSYVCVCVCLCFCTFVHTRARACVRVCHGVCVRINCSIARAISLSFFLCLFWSLFLSLFLSLSLSLPFFEQVRTGCLSILMLLRVVPSRISNLERKRGQYQDYGFIRAKRQWNVASKRRYLRNVWKEPCRGCRFVTFVTFLCFFDILGFAKKNSKIHTVWQKPRNVTKFKIVTLWHLEMSQNVTKCHTV